VKALGYGHARDEKGDECRERGTEHCDFRVKQADTGCEGPASGNFVGAARARYECAVGQA
jgi:hypothetical protein